MHRIVLMALLLCCLAMFIVSSEGEKIEIPIQPKELILEQQMKKLIAIVKERIAINE